MHVVRVKSGMSDFRTRLKQKLVHMIRKHFVDRKPKGLSAFILKKKQQFCFKNQQLKNCYLKSIETEYVRDLI